MPHLIKAFKSAGLSLVPPPRIVAVKKESMIEHAFEINYIFEEQSFRLKQTDIGVEYIPVMQPVTGRILECKAKMYMRYAGYGDDSRALGTLINPAAYGNNEILGGFDRIIEGDFMTFQPQD